MHPPPPSSIHLRPAPPTPTQLISTSIQLHPPPLSSFQPPSSSTHLHLAHFTRNWAISPKLGQLKLSISTKNWHTWYIEGADSKSRRRFLKLRPQNLLLGKFGPKKLKLFFLLENWHKWYIEDVDSYSNISFLDFLPKNHFGANWAKKIKVIRFVWKLTHMVHRGCWFLFQH